MKGFIKFLTILFVFGVGLQWGKVQAGEVKFTFATTNSPKDLSSQAVMKWQKAMKEASKGELDMTFIPGGALGDDKQLLQQLSMNEIQLHVAGPVVVHHLVREYQCMEAEFVYNDEAHGFRVWNGPLGEEVKKKLESQYNITILGVGSRGARHLTSNVPIRKPEDMKGLRSVSPTRFAKKSSKPVGLYPDLSLSLNFTAHFAKVFMMLKRTLYPPFGGINFMRYKNTLTSQVTCGAIGFSVPTKNLWIH